MVVWTNFAGGWIPVVGDEPKRLKFGAWWRFIPDFLPVSEADRLLEICLERPDWAQLPIVVFGKEVMQPRLMAWEGDLPYRYSGLTLEPRPCTSPIAELSQRAADRAATSFNHVMLNLYRSGADRIGPHADDEPELGPDPIIASLSLGETRRFVAQPKRRFKSKRKERLQLTHGSLLIMGGAFQRNWYHGVPAQPERIGPRVNITFRQLGGPPGWRPPLGSEATNHDASVS